MGKVPNTKSSWAVYLDRRLRISSIQLVLTRISIIKGSTKETLEKFFLVLHLLKAKIKCQL
jgi:hypothetical protein